MEPLERTFRKNISRVSISLVLGLLAVMASSSVAWAKDCTYTIEGDVEVEHHNFMKGFLGRAESDLEDVQVRVMARKKILFGAWGPWAVWGTVRTDNQGEFNVAHTKNCADRQFRVRVKFQSPELEIRHETATSALNKVKWYEVWSGSAGESSDTMTVDARFDGSGHGALGSRNQWYHAEIWHLYSEAIDQFDSYPGNVGFTDKVKVKYPHEKQKIDPYANPLNNVIYLIRRPDGSFDSGQSIEVMLHELAHIWAYQHSRMENNMAGYLVTHAKEGTHGMVDKTFVAFHEGFARWATDNLYRDLSPNSVRRWVKSPLSPSEMKNEGIDDFSKVDYSEWGWYTLFALMQKNKLWQFDWGTGDRRLDRTKKQMVEIAPHADCEVAQLDFPELLAVFEAGGRDIHTKEMDWKHFTDRVVKASNGVSRGDVDKYRVMLDPDSDTSEILDEMCDSKIDLTPQPKLPGETVPKTPDLDYP